VANGRAEWCPALTLPFYGPVDAMQHLLTPSPALGSCSTLCQLSCCGRDSCAGSLTWQSVASPCRWSAEGDRLRRVKRCRRGGVLRRRWSWHVAAAFQSCGRCTDRWVDTCLPARSRQGPRAGSGGSGQVRRCRQFLRAALAVASRFSGERCRAMPSCRRCHCTVQPSARARGPAVPAGLTFLTSGAGS